MVLEGVWEEGISSSPPKSEPYIPKAADTISGGHRHLFPRAFLKDSLCGRRNVQETICAPSGGAEEIKKMVFVKT